MTSAGIALLDNPIRDYAWGSKTAIYELMGVSPDGRSAAELWMGAHSAAPSRIIDDSGRASSLLRMIEHDPEQELGHAVFNKFGPRLPFLAKVIAAAEPLSLQAHPTTAQAEAGFDAEQRRGIPIDAVHRNYKDRFHKPELLVALTEFRGLCGFAETVRTVALLDRLCVPALAPYVDVLKNRPGSVGLRQIVGELLQLSTMDKERLVSAVLQACGEHTNDQDFAPEYQMALRLGEKYPADTGVIIAMLLNLVVLQPGQAVFMPAGNLHAYLHGVGVEIMANSDNTLRGGLTTKHIDVAELLRILDFSPQPPHISKPRRDQSNEDVFETPVSEFVLSRLLLQPDTEISITNRCPQILLTVHGSAEVSTEAGSTVPLNKGASAFISAHCASVIVRGNGTVFRATTNISA